MTVTFTDRKRFLFENSKKFLQIFDKNENITDEAYFILEENDIEANTITYLKQLVNADEREFETALAEEKKQK